jgi:hypothetical protein
MSTRGEAFETAGMKRHLVVLAAAACVSTAASAAYAHHSHPYFYDQCRSIAIDGRVESVQWKNPHTVIVLRMDNGAAYTVDWNGLTALTRDGVLNSAKATLVFGTRIAVSGNPIRTAAQIREHFPDYTSEVNPNTVDPITIRRVDNSFTWARRADAMSPDCGRQ